MILLACAPDIRDLDGDGVLDVALDDTATETGTGSSSETVLDNVTVSLEGEAWKVVVDSNEGITYVDFDLPAQVPEEQVGWEVNFERYFFFLNGGSSGDEGVEVVPLDGVGFEEVTDVPTEGWITDTEDALALDEWYIYDSTEHVMYAAETVYVMRNGEGSAWKLQFLSYYDDAGNTGFPSFLLQRLE